jgi:hypothetical protein
VSPSLAEHAKPFLPAQLLIWLPILGGFATLAFGNARATAPAGSPPPSRW